MKREMKRFKHKLLIESLVKACVRGITCGAVVLFVFLVVMHLLSREPEVWLIVMVFGLPFLLTALLLFLFRYYPTQRRTATRIDASGLAERIGTMLEMKDVHSTIAELQRKDAMKHLQEATTKQIRIVLTKSSLVTCSIMVCLSIGLLFVPYNIMNAFAGEQLAEAEENEKIEAMIEELRNLVEEADVSDELKKQLYDVIEELEESILKDDTTLEKVAKISAARKKIQEILESTITKYSIGSALQQFESTKELGKAISAGDTEAVSTALQTTKESFLSSSGEEQAELLANVSEDIAQALTISGVESGDALYDALSIYSDSLSEISKDASSQDVSSKIEAAVSTAEEAIIAALTEQAGIEETAENLNDIMDEAKDDLLGNETQELQDESGESPEGEEGEKPEDGEKPEGEGEEKPENGEKPEGEDSGQTQGGEASGEGEGEGLGNMTEEIYDSSIGNVEYGEVFATYYAEYMASLEEGEIPEDMQTIIEEYFNSLNQ